MNGLIYTHVCRLRFQENVPFIRTIRTKPSKFNHRGWFPVKGITTIAGLHWRPALFQVDKMDAVVHLGCSKQVLLDWNPWPVRWRWGQDISVSYCQRSPSLPVTEVRLCYGIAPTTPHGNSSLQLAKLTTFYFSRLLVQTLVRGIIYGSGGQGRATKWITFYWSPPC